MDRPIIQTAAQALLLSNDVRILKAMLNDGLHFMMDRLDRDIYAWEDAHRIAVEAYGMSIGLTNNRELVEQKLDALVGALSQLRNTERIDDQLRTAHSALVSTLVFQMLRLEPALARYYDSNPEDKQHG